MKKRLIELSKKDISKTLNEKEFKEFEELYFKQFGNKNLRLVFY